MSFCPSQFSNYFVLGQKIEGIERDSGFQEQENFVEIGSNPIGFENIDEGSTLNKIIDKSNIIEKEENLIFTGISQLSQPIHAPTEMNVVSEDRNPSQLTKAADYENDVHSGNDLKKSENYTDLSKTDINDNVSSDSPQFSITEAEEITTGSNIDNGKTNEETNLENSFNIEEENKDFKNNRNEIEPSNIKSLLYEDYDYGYWEPGQTF